MARKTVTIAIITKDKDVVTLTCDVDINEIQNDNEYQEGDAIGDYVATGKMVKRFSPNNQDSPYIEGHIVTDKVVYDGKWHNSKVLFDFLNSDSDRKDDTHE